MQPMLVLLVAFMQESGSAFKRLQSLANAQIERHMLARCLTLLTTDSTPPPFTTYLKQENQGNVPRVRDCSFGC
jgi:hypothetical protein